MDKNTQLINKDVPTVLKYLFDLYGRVPSEEVKQKEAEIKAMIFHPADPIILLYNPINKLIKMAVAAKIPYTDKRVLNIGLTVIRNTRDFEKALGNWESLAAARKYWQTFQTHFKDAQKQLKAIHGPTMQQAGYHHANHLAQQLRTDIQQRDNDLLLFIQSAVKSTTTPPSITPSDVSTVTEIQHHANAMQSDPVQPEILKLLQQM